jgi:hypothetical protein
MSLYDSVEPSTIAQNARANYAEDIAGGGAGYAEYDMSMEPAPAPQARNEEVQNQQSSGDLANRKLIKNANLSVETEEFDVLLAAIDQRVSNLGGYMENYNVYNNSRYNSSSSNYNRSASMTIRVPSVNYDFFMNEIASISNVLSRSESTRDVTLEYVDIESRRAALNIEYERLLELLEKAETIDDVIRLESRLSDVRYNIEWISSQLRTYDNLVDYSTIYLDISEVKELTPVKELTTWERIGTGFVNSLKNVGNGFKNVILSGVIGSPYLVVFAVFVVIIVVIIKVIIKIATKKMENRPPKPPLPPLPPAPKKEDSQ